MALLTAPVPGVRTGTGVGPGSRIAARARSTPGRLTALMVLLALLGLLAGIASVVGIMQRSALVDGVRNGSGPLAIQAQQLYRSLSDADATAASAFLSNGVEPAALRERYQNDIAAASAALAAVTAGGGTDEPAALRQVSTQLPVYTGLVDTARAYSRLAKPLGAAYLREASGLMREQLLPAAKALYLSENTRLGIDIDGGAEFPWLAIPLLVITIAGLVLAQRYLSRRTHRLLNVGLVVATGAAVLMLGWITLSLGTVYSHLDAGRQRGSSQVDFIARVRIAALTARADEALTLVARGSGSAFDKGFDDSMREVAGDDGVSGELTEIRDSTPDPAVHDVLETARTDAKTWYDAHRKLRVEDNGGNYNGAVKLAIGDDPASAASAFNRLDSDLAKGIATASATFDREARGAADGFAVAAPGLVVLTLLMLVGLVAGFQQRIAEYR